MSKKKPDHFNSETVVESDAQPEVVSTMQSTEETEQIGRDIIVGHKEVGYEDGRNVISVIINALSVRINMPRGTVKALMACFVILLIAILVHACDAPDAGKSVSEEKEDTAKRSYVSSETSESIAKKRDIVISENYSYTLPAGSTREKSGLGEAYVNAQEYSFLNDSEELCVVRSYMTRNTEGDLRATVQDRIGRIVDITNVSYEEVSCGIGTVLLCRGETVDAEDNRINVMEYSWEDGDLAICSLQVSSPSDELETTAQALLDTVRRSDNNISNREMLLAADSLPISAHYSYYMPEGVTGVWEPEEPYAENEIFCDFEYEGEQYTITSFLLQYRSEDWAEQIKGFYSELEVFRIIDEQYSETDFGRMLTLRFETADENGDPCVVTGYYWSDIDPYLCCLEVSAAEWGDGEVEQMVLDSVYRNKESSSAHAEPAPYDARQIYDEQMKEEAMDSLAEDAVKDYYEPEPERSGLPF